MFDVISYVLSRKYVKESLKGLGALKGAPCKIKNVVHQDGVNTITFEWEGNDGTKRETTISVYDGTPIYVWESGDTYHYGDLVIYESAFYRCIVENSDVDFDDTKWNEIGSPDGNYDIVATKDLLPARFTSADRKMYYVIDEMTFYLWDGYNWIAQMNVVQYATMPTASAKFLDRVVQYVGATDANYTNCHFYKCVSNGATPAVYSWKKVNVEELPFVTLEMFGAVGDGLTNDTAAFNSAVASGKEIHLLNKVYLVGATISQDHTTIKGKGKIKGTLTIQASYVSISDVEFQSGGSCIILKEGKYLTFDKIRTDMCKDSFRIPKPTKHQPVSRVLVSNSILASEYGFNCDDDEYQYYSIGDLQIENTQFFSKVYGIRGKWIDGLVVNGCTFFTQAHEAHLTDKKENINVVCSNYVNITGCNLFEAGNESVYLSDVRGVTINGNNIVWPGQVTPSGGIVIDGIKKSVNLSSIVIANNNIQYPTDDAIVIKNVDDTTDANENYVISISDNVALNVLGTTFYYGTDPLKNQAYVVSSSTTNPAKVLIDNNIGTGSVYPPYAMTNKQLTENVNILNHDVEALNSIPIDNGAGTNAVVINDTTNNTAAGANALAEGSRNTASGYQSHAEGYETISSGLNSHAEGQGSQSTATASHSEGFYTKATGMYSHAQNRGAVANGLNQTALGRFNIIQGSPTESQDTDQAVIIGNGSNANNRSNALAIQWDGTVVMQDGSTIKSAKTVYDVMGKMGAKNLIPYPYEYFGVRTQSGVTFVLNDDGSVTLDGTATENIYKLFLERDLGNAPFSSKYDNPNAQYKITLLNGTSNVFCNYNPNDHYITLVVLKDTTVDNLTVYPMLRLADDQDDTWQPYAKTNKQLTDDSAAFMEGIRIIGNLVNSFGTAAQKNSTDRVMPNSTDLVESQSVYSAINTALSSVYTPAGEITCAELTSSLLIEANVGKVYELSDAGTTTALFLQGAGKPLAIGDSVGIINAGQGRILFNLMANRIDLSSFQKKDLTQTVEGAITVEGALSALSANKVAKVTGKGLSTNDYDNTEKQKVANAIQKSQTAGLVKNDGTIDETAYAKQSEMSITDGTGADAGTATIQLKSGTSKKVLTEHQDISGKQNKTLASSVEDETTVEGALGALSTNKMPRSAHKVTSFEVTTSGWTTDTTSQSGTTLYKKTISLSHVYVDKPSVDIGAASGSVLPTTAQQTAYDLLKYATIDGTTLTLYASAIPATAFYINVEGVD